MVVRRSRRRQRRRLHCWTCSPRRWPNWRLQNVVGIVHSLLAPSYCVGDPKEAPYDRLSEPRPGISQPTSYAVDDGFFFAAPTKTKEQSPYRLPDHQIMTLDDGTRRVATASLDPKQRKSRSAADLALRTRKMQLDEERLEEDRTYLLTRVSEVFLQVANAKTRATSTRPTAPFRKTSAMPIAPWR